MSFKERKNGAINKGNVPDRDTLILGFITHKHWILAILQYT